MKRNVFSETRLMMIVYDTMIFFFSCAVLVFLLFVNGRMNWHMAMLLAATFALCLIVARLIWRTQTQVWRYGGIQAYLRLILADCCAYLFLFGAFQLIERFRIPWFCHVRVIELFTLSAMNLLFALSIRMVYRYACKVGTRNDARGKISRFLLKTFAFGRVSRTAIDPNNQSSLAIIGAGPAGVALAEELLSNPSSSYRPLMFVDNDPEKIGKTVHGLPVIAQDDNLANRLRESGIKEVVLALPSLGVEQKREVYDLYHNEGFRVKTYDSSNLQDGGRVQMREFSIEDLLARDEMKFLSEKVRSFYNGKTVLITGVGSIGSELARQVAQAGPKRLILLDIYENGVYDVQQALKIKYGGEIDVCCEICSVTDEEALVRVFETYRPQIVLHAAAHKHVPLMEHNCVEAVKNNVFGTLNVVRACVLAGTERMMMVSTDKAVNPTNVMGATKRMCEEIVHSYAARGGNTTFSATRFGNVLGSAGSVIPLFKRQIAAGGPITLTDKRIIRYFMTIPEASQLVLESAAAAKNGETFVLDMGKPVRILDLAENMIRLSGLTPYRDIDIKKIGLRPGEKLYEETLVEKEKLERTENNRIFIDRETPLSEKELERRLNLLRLAVANGDDRETRLALMQAVPTFRDRDEVNAEATAAKEMREVYGENEG